MIRLISLPPPPFCLREALRYAGVNSPSPDGAALMESAWREAESHLSYQVCWGKFPLSMAEDACDPGFACIKSRALARHLAGCEAVIVMGATLGVGLDRLIMKYGRLSPARALSLQALGAERIEALCDAFCEKIGAEAAAEGLYLTSRFSPGYGDLPLETQRDIFRILRPEGKIGLTLNDSMIMSPSKSVTALIGLSRDKKNPPANPCRGCGKGDCAYRRSI